MPNVQPILGQATRATLQVATASPMVVEDHQSALLMLNVRQRLAQATLAMPTAVTASTMVVEEDHTGAILMLNVRQRMAQATLAIPTAVHASTLAGMVDVKKVQSMLLTIVRMDHGRLAKYARMELGSKNHRPAHNALMATGRLSTIVPTERHGRLATYARMELGSKNHRPAHNALPAKPRFSSIALTE